MATTEVKIDGVPIAVDQAWRKRSRKTDGPTRYKLFAIVGIDTNGKIPLARRTPVVVKDGIFRCDSSARAPIPIRLKALAAKDTGYKHVGTLGAGVSCEAEV